MPLKQFIVPLGVSILTFAIVGIYLHCRQRLNALENKMNILFQLIQQHTASLQDGQQIATNEHPQEGRGNLIAVSDDERTDSESSDSTLLPSTHSSPLPTEISLSKRPASITN